MNRIATLAALTLLSCGPMGWLLESPTSAQTVITGHCPLLVSASQRDLQPKRLPPEQVAEKNRRGCLSPFDAVYGRDGCPLTLCGAEAGVIPLTTP